MLGPALFRSHEAARLGLLSQARAGSQPKGEAGAASLQGRAGLWSRAWESPAWSLLASQLYSCPWGPVTPQVRLFRSPTAS